MNNESRTHGVNRQLTKGQTAALFLTCMAVPALVAWLGCMLSGMTGYTAARAPYIPNGMVSSIIWTACYAFLGIGLFLAITADTRHRGQRAVKMWSLSLWGTLFTLSLVWPFLMFTLNMYMLSFVWMVIADAIAVALIIVNFRLRPASAFMIIPFAVVAAFLTYAAFYAAMYI